MTAPTLHRALIPANLAWFALFSAGTSIATGGMGYFLPLTGASGYESWLGLAGYFVAVYFAGAQFAKRTDHAWTGDDRSLLALGYATVSLLVSAALLFLLMAVTGVNVIPDLGPDAPLLWGVICLGVTLFAAAATKIFLWQISKQPKTSGTR